jgi:hypothetical protein
MPEELEGGFDTREILAEIGASSALPSGGNVAAVPAPEAAPPAESPRTSGRSKSRLVRHRRQVAALILIFVALLWISVGLAAQDGAPAAIGGVSLVLAALVGVDLLLR